MAADFPALSKRAPGRHMDRGLSWTGEIRPESPDAGVNLCGGAKPAARPLRKARPDTDITRMVRLLDGLRRMPTGPTGIAADAATDSASDQE